MYVAEQPSIFAARVISIALEPGERVGFLTIARALFHLRFFLAIKSFPPPEALTGIRWGMFHPPPACIGMARYIRRVRCRRLHF
tara:strand:- start:930 stop:1181 length:252 start_codon:yes stop_codon:yes gene_type:complete